MRQDLVVIPGASAREVELPIAVAEPTSLLQPPLGTGGEGRGHCGGDQQRLAVPSGVARP